MSGVDVKVAVPLWALRFILEHGDFDDKGPRDEGWPSEDMEQALVTLKSAMDRPA